MKKVSVCLIFAMSVVFAGAQEVPHRPQEPRPPFPYITEEVVFENPGAGIKLAGTLTIPSVGGEFPAVVLLTGSGAQNRDEELLGHKPFFVLADHLTRRGIAVLRFDDRGVGGSEGDHAASTTVDFAADAISAVDYLRTRGEIKPTGIGLAGHSEGGLVAFIAAADHPSKVAFVVSMAGPGVKGEDLSVMQMEDILLQRGMTAEVAKTYADKQRRDLALIVGNTPEFVEAKLDSIAGVLIPGFNFLPEATKNTARTQIRGSNSPWARFFMTHDPAEDIARVKCPVLAVNGGRDLQVRPSVNLAAIRAALERGGNDSFETIEYPGLNHLFQTAATGSLEEYATLEETISPRVPDDIATWILKETE